MKAIATVTVLALLALATMVAGGRGIDAQVPQPASVDLVAGANLIVYQGVDGPVEQTLGDAAASVSSIWRFQASSQDWELWATRLPAALRAFSSLESGRAYFVIADAAVTWIFADFLLPTGTDIDVAGLSLTSSTTINTVTEENRDAVIDDILAGAVFPRINDGAWEGSIDLATALGIGLVTQEEVDAFTAKLADMVAVGQDVVEFGWTADDGSTFTTLAVLEPGGTIAFEPLGYLAAEPAVVEEEVVTAGLRSAQIPSEMVMVAGNLTNWYGHKVIEYEFDATIFTQIVQIGMVTHFQIISQVENINFGTLPLWEAKATKTVTRFQRMEGEYTLIDCKTVQVTLVWANGFKEVSGAVEADGFSVSLTVKGSLGANGQIQFSRTFCADGSRG